MSIRKAVWVWLLILPAMIANGIVRETVLVSSFSRTTADIMSAILGIIIILAITGLFFRRVTGISTSTLVGISLIWLVLTVAFEFIFGHYVDKKPWSELVQNYALWEGRLWPLVLLTLVLSPFIWTSAR